MVNLIGLLIPFLGTMLGSAFVFCMRQDMPVRLQKALLGFASGVMVAASVWSLLIPAIEAESAKGPWAVMPAAVGFLLGILFLLAIDELTPHLHVGANTPEGPRSKLSRTAMLALAVTIHNLPEGMAVGVVLAGATQGTAELSMSAAIAVSLGIAIQNIPEGAIISMPMRAAGNSRWRSFLIGSLSGIVEPIGGLLVILLAAWSRAAICLRLFFCLDGLAATTVSCKAIGCSFRTITCSAVSPLTRNLSPVTSTFSNPINETTTGEEAGKLASKRKIPSLLVAVPNSGATSGYTVAYEIGCPFSSTTCPVYTAALNSNAHSSTMNKILNFKSIIGYNPDASSPSSRRSSSGTGIPP